MRNGGELLAQLLHMGGQLLVAGGWRYMGRVGCRGKEHWLR